MPARLHVVDGLTVGVILVPLSYAPTVAPQLAPLHTVLVDPLKNIMHHPPPGVTSPISICLLPLQAQ
eukprot:m.288935 g.288935  ORF g.288935 m.288935 type:complete len:67 (+) comp27101_c0_seq25:377-577(+)